VHESFDDTIPWRLGHHYTFVTEKTFYNIAMQRPFVVQGYPGSLKFLHDLGYETFDRWWPEDYDRQQERERLNSVWDIFLYLNKKTRNELALMCREMRHVLEHNYNNYVDKQKQRYHFREFDPLLESLL
jgi:hypothetical protein